MKSISSFLSRTFASIKPNPARNGLVQPKAPSSDNFFHLTSGSKLPGEALVIRYATWGHPSNPPVLIFPSMSNSALVTDHPGDTDRTGGLWWNKVVGNGAHFGVDTSKFHVISLSPLGSPYGSTSPKSIDPETGVAYGRDFPQITPRDQARFGKMLLDNLGIHKLHAVVGGSMGGMQSLEFAAEFPEMYDRLVVIAATGQTSPATVALRSIQRAAVMMNRENPAAGLHVARMIGMMCYRSREEIDGRFPWSPDDTGVFEVEKYLQHHGDKFSRHYDPNCYMTLSMCMDLMNLGHEHTDFQEGAKRIPADKQIYLLGYSTDVLTPSKELEKLSVILGSRPDSRVLFENLPSEYGHDTFLMERHQEQLNLRLAPFLSVEGGFHTLKRALRDME